MLDPALDPHAPHLLPRSRKPQLRKRNPHLHGPPERVDRGYGLPHGVPQIVRVASVVSQQGVALHTGGIHDEFEGGAAVVVAVQQHPEFVAVRVHVAASQSRDDVPGRGVEQARADVQCIGVVQDAHLGGLRRGRSFVGVALDQLRDRGRGRPGRLVQPPVEDGPGTGCHAHYRNRCDWVRNADRLDGP